jgi:lipopolysaccharide/colanic/teichoic acid biosynthesis glycosyltransferase
MNRLFEIILAVWLLTVLSIPMAIIVALIRLGSKGQALYWSDRIGKGNTVFKMPKFRTMRQGTPAIATHLLNHPCRYVTPIGSILRKLSDEYYLHHRSFGFDLHILALTIIALTIIIVTLLLMPMSLCLGVLGAGILLLWIQRRIGVV